MPSRPANAIDYAREAVLRADHWVAEIDSGVDVDEALQHFPRSPGGTAPSPDLGRLFVGDFGQVRTLLSVLYGNRANLTLPVEIQQRVLVEITRLGNLDFAKLDVQSVGLGKILDSHRLKDRSKKAL